MEDQAEQPGPSRAQHFPMGVPGALAAQPSSRLVLPLQGTAASRTSQGVGDCSRGSVHTEAGPGEEGRQTHLFRDSEVLGLGVVLLTVSGHG